LIVDAPAGRGRAPSPTVTPPEPPPVTFADRKAAKLDAINQRLNTVLTGGYTVKSGAMAGKVL
jgi:hypothetical protein